MCRAVRCRACGKTTWSGCGDHVAELRAGVRADQWCAGHANNSDAPTSWVRRLIGNSGGNR